MGFLDMSDIKSRKLAEGVEMKVLSGEKMMMVFFHLQPGVVISEHSHPNEQMGVVLEGEVELIIDGEKKVAQRGDVYYIPPGVVHSGKACAAPARVLDVFSPPREDYRILG